MPNNDLDTNKHLNPDKALNRLFLNPVPSKTPLFFPLQLVNNAINAPKKAFWRLALGD